MLSDISLFITLIKSRIFKQKIDIKKDLLFIQQFTFCKIERVMEILDKNISPAYENFKVFKLYDLTFCKIERVMEILDKNISPAYEKAKELNIILEKHELIMSVLNKIKNLDKIFGFKVKSLSNPQEHMVS